MPSPQAWSPALLGAGAHGPRVVPQHIAMLHHVLMTNGGQDARRHDGSCSRRPVKERFYGTSEELRAMTVPRGYGHPTNCSLHPTVMSQVVRVRPRSR